MKAKSKAPAKRKVDPAIKAKADRAERRARGEDLSADPVKSPLNPPVKKKAAPKAKPAPAKSTTSAEIDGKPVERRGNPAWTKGVSGNPGGMPRGMAEVKKLARSYTNQAIMTLASIMQNEDVSAPARVSAATALLDRGYGKPLQQVEVGNPGDFSEMSDAEVDAFIRNATRELTAGIAGGYMAESATAH